MNDELREMTKEQVIKIYGFDPEKVGNRNRGWWVIESIEDEERTGNAKVGDLAVKTRDGASNPMSAEDCKRPNFVGTAEDGFDCTYRYYYYCPLKREMTIKEKAKEITECIYQAYGSDTGYLLGIHPESRHTVEVIVESTLKVLEFQKKKKEEAKK